MSSATTRYVHAGVQAIEEYDGTTSGANLRRLYVFGGRIDQVVAMEAPDAADIDQDSNTTEVLRFSFHTQLIGSVTQVTAPSGSVAESYEYDPYGKPTIKDGGGSTISASAIGNSYLFTARQLDAETGLYYYRARHYSPELRRFVQRDPLEYVDGMNTIAYVKSAPVGHADPSGLRCPDYYCWGSATATGLVTVWTKFNIGKQSVRMQIGLIVRQAIKDAKKQANEYCDGHIIGNSVTWLLSSCRCKIGATPKGTTPAPGAAGSAEPSAEDLGELFESAIEWGTASNGLGITVSNAEVEPSWNGYSFLDSTMIAAAVAGVTSFSQRVSVTVKVEGRCR